MSLVRIEVSTDVEGGTNKVVLFNSLPSDRFVDFAVVWSVSPQAYKPSTKSERVVERKASALLDP